MLSYNDMFRNNDFIWRSEIGLNFLFGKYKIFKFGF